MKIRLRVVLKAAGCALALLLAAGVAAPYFTADQYRARLEGSIERALGRRVELGRVTFSLFNGPGFSVDRVVIHEDPAIGLEPMVYVQDPGSMEIVPSIWSLLGGRFVIASIRLSDASINLTKTGPADQPGRWNFSSFINRSMMSRAPAIHVRDGRINFKFGDTKSVFYLTNTDLDISPPGSLSGGWKVECSSMPARTDRSAQGLGSFTIDGRWYVAPERVDLNLELDRSGLGELTALVRGQSGSVHGTISSRLHLGGPINNIGIQGRLNIQDVHRWDLLPGQGQDWPLDVQGRLDLPDQLLELQSSSAANATPPLSVRFRVADYLSQPHWAVAANWNRFPVAPLMELAVHMGAQFPPRLKLGGTLDGALGYSGQGSLQGELAFHDAVLTIPDSPPLGAEQAHIVFDHGVVRLTPAVVRTADQDEARMEAAYSMDEGTLDLSISTDAMKVASLRSQVALAAVPWLEQVRSGQFSGRLAYHRDTGESVWTGDLQLQDARMQIAGLADPLAIAEAHAQIHGARVAIDHLEAQAGPLEFTGDYRYEPGTTRPHRPHLHLAEADASAIEAELAPTLVRGGLIARAFGRVSLPDWLKRWDVDGSIQIDDLTLAGSHLSGVRAHILWDGGRAELDGLQARLDHAALNGQLAVNLRGASPTYKLAAKVKGLSWQSGKVDAEGLIQTSGTGAQLVANLTSEGVFTGAALDFGSLTWRSVSGSYQLGPRLRLTGLKLRTDDDTYTGRGTALDDAHLVIVLNNGTRDLRMIGTLARLRVEDALK
ncbi:MAG TPA: hypothetical protein VME43_32630 [Bryobacteraceae bacterium]|nr:hypothetical protein [Bryobacteraceae bacterium]